MKTNKRLFISFSVLIFAAICSFLIMEQYTVSYNSGYDISLCDFAEEENTENGFVSETDECTHSISPVPYDSIEETFSESYCYSEENIITTAAESNRAVYNESFQNENVSETDKSEISLPEEIDSLTSVNIQKIDTESVTDCISPEENSTEFPENHCSDEETDPDLSLSENIVSSSVSSQVSDSFNVFGETYTGILSSPEDSCEFNFYVQERGYISFVLSHNSFTGTGGWLVILESEYYENGVSGNTAFRKISTLICKSDKTKHSSVNVGVIPGNYKITIVPYIKTVETKFNICVSFTSGSDYEIECNDTISRYTEFYPGKTICGTASFADNTDTDWFIFTMYSDGVIKLKFDHPSVDVSSVLWKVFVYDSEGNELYGENSYGTAESIDSGSLGLVSGVYYIKIVSRVYSNVVYSLSAERVTTGIYEDEINDTVETATVCKINTSIYGNSSSRQNSSDKDYFKFTVKKSGVAIINFTHDEISSESDKKAWNIVLTDSVGNILYNAECTYSRKKIVSSSIGLPSGTYYICVDCDNCYRVDTDYCIVFKYNANSAYETEYNNVHSLADLLNENNMISGNLTKGKTDYDKDCYYIDLKKDGKVDITFSHSIINSTNNYYCISLFDSDNKKITFYTSSGTQCVGTVLCSATTNELKFSAELSVGTYYLDISVGDYYSDSTYTIIYKETVY